MPGSLPREKSYLNSPPAAVEEAQVDQRAADEKFAGQHAPDGRQAHSQPQSDDQHADETDAQHAKQRHAHNHERVAGSAQGPTEDQAGGEAGLDEAGNEETLRGEMNDVGVGGREPLGRVAAEGDHEKAAEG